MNDQDERKNDSPVKAENLRLVDCTIRDGGLTNHHDFSERLVNAAFEATSASGIWAVELGYRNSPRFRSPKEHGPWMFSEDAVLRRVTDGVKDPARVSVMADVGRVDPDTVGPASDTPVDVVRTATYVADVAEAIELSDGFLEKGYETTINIMAISRDRGPELVEALRRLEAECRTPVAYVVDSFGALHPPEVTELVELFRRECPSKAIGFHGHNHQQLAFANSLSAVAAGATYIDGTLYGIGRAAGNCPLELLVGSRREPEYDLRPLLEVIAKEIVPLRESVEWGYTIPYAITGLLNQHPRAAMALLGTAEEREYEAFFESVLRTVAEEKD